MLTEPVISSNHRKIGLLMRIHHRSWIRSTDPLLRRYRSGLGMELVRRENSEHCGDNGAAFVEHLS
jgi:hypothetical protein